MEEAIAYWNEKGLSGDPQVFWLHFENNGWRVSGRTPMKDWHLAAQQWSRNEIVWRNSEIRPKAQPRSHQVFEALPVSISPKVEALRRWHEANPDPKIVDDPVEAARLQMEIDALLEGE
jgi:hypothetical protein